jgi:hypothetical protein
VPALERITAALRDPEYMAVIVVGDWRRAERSMGEILFFYKL